MPTHLLLVLLCDSAKFLFLRNSRVRLLKMPNEKGCCRLRTMAIRRFCGYLRDAQRIREDFLLPPVLLSFAIRGRARSRGRDSFTANSISLRSLDRLMQLIIFFPFFLATASFVPFYPASYSVERFFIICVPIGFLTDEKRKRLSSRTRRTINDVIFTH